MEKKRAMIMVDKDAWEGTMQLLKDFKIHPQVFNEMLNEFIRSQYKLLRTLKEKKEEGATVTFGDFLQMMGKIVNEIDDEQLKLS